MIKHMSRCNKEVVKIDFLDFIMANLINPRSSLTPYFRGAKPVIYLHYMVIWIIKK